MELIAKVTSRCDMACTFCGAANTSYQDLTPEEIASVANKLNAQSIIIAGGEALLLPPTYYKKLLSLTTAHIDFISNLKRFYLSPDEWTPIFTHPRISVCTSFNYGNTRLWDKNTVYTEAMFKEVMHLFKERVGYTPIFISVLDENNVNTWKQTVMLAKELDTKCRLNNALKIGRQAKLFPRYHLIKIWIEIVKRGWDKYEINSFERGTGRCPSNTNFFCQSSIRVMRKNESGDIIFYNCDDMSWRDEEQLSIEEVYANQHIEMQPKKVLTPNCYSCELFRLCNGCRSYQQQIEDVETHCREMTAMKQDIIDLGWKL